MKKVLLFIILVSTFQMDIFAQKGIEKTEEFMAVNIGYVGFPGYEKGGFHMDITDIMKNRFGFSSGIDFFSLSSGAATFIDINFIYALTNKTIFLYPYGGLSIGIFSDKEDVGSYDPMDYLDGLNVGLEVGGAISVILNKISLNFGWGYNTMLKSSSIMKFSIGYVIE